MVAVPLFALPPAIDSVTGGAEAARPLIVTLAGVSTRGGIRSGMPAGDDAAWMCAGSVTATAGAGGGADGGAAGDDGADGGAGCAPPSVPAS